MLRQNAKEKRDLAQGKEVLSKGAVVKFSLYSQDLRKKSANPCPQISYVTCNGDDFGIFLRLSKNNLKQTNKKNHFLKATSILHFYTSPVGRDACCEQISAVRSTLSRI